MASSPTRPATTPRAWPVPRACSGRLPWSSCRRTRRPSSVTGSLRTAQRSSSSGPSSDERLQVAHAIAAERGLSIIPPYDDDRIIAGQGTVGLEIVEDLPDVGVILVPIGGGGLASGVATAARALRPDIRVIGVEPELAADARESLTRGEIVRWSAEDVGRTIADGTRTQALGQRTFRHLRAYLDRVVTVTEAEIVAARPPRCRAEPARRGTVGRPARGGARVPAGRNSASMGARVRWSPSSAAGTWTRSDTASTWRPRSGLKVHSRPDVEVSRPCRAPRQGGPPVAARERGWPPDPRRPPDPRAAWPVPPIASSRTSAPSAHR